MKMTINEINTISWLIFSVYAMWPTLYSHHVQKVFGKVDFHSLLVKCSVILATGKPPSIAGSIPARNARFLPTRFRQILGQNCRGRRNSLQVPA